RLSLLGSARPTVKMHVKYAVALILVLQVSVGLCEVPEPSKELLDKYIGLKALFYRRILKAYSKFQGSAAPLIEHFSQSEHGQAAAALAGGSEVQRGYQAALKIAAAAAAELEPVVDKARLSALGAYEQYLRPHIGESLDDGIASVQAVLDNFMPAE
ncbi:hypothetical protein EE079_30955, partial [Klebsiella pneumoniae]|nr:hypothetical protein [Klebsiella pneumoniae]